VPLFWDRFHYDIREMIYKELLRDAGTRHHVTDAGPQRARPLMRTRCHDRTFLNGSSCGHQDCMRRRTESLQDLMSLMRTCKAAYVISSVSEQPKPLHRLTQLQASRRLGLSLPQDHPCV
jgi:hypothetical protein